MSIKIYARGSLGLGTLLYEKVLTSSEKCKHPTLHKLHVFLCIVEKDRGSRVLVRYFCALVCLPLSFLALPSPNLPFTGSLLWCPLAYVSTVAQQLRVPGRPCITYFSSLTPCTVEIGTLHAFTQCVSDDFIFICAAFPGYNENICNGWRHVFPVACRGYQHTHTPALWIHDP